VRTGITELAKVIADQPVNRFRIVSFVNDVTIGLSVFCDIARVSWTRLFEATNPLISCFLGINSDRSFLDMFSEFTGSFKEIVAAVLFRKTG